jgi:hypothetical protein
MGNLIWAALIAVGGVSAEVRLVTGPGTKGELLELTTNTVTVRADGENRQAERADLWEIRFPEHAPNETLLPSIWIELIDGSLLHAVQLTVSSNEATILLTSDANVTCRTRHIRSVRLRPFSDTNLAEQWNQLTSNRPASDMIVLRRGDNLDQLQGRLHDVTEEIVQFEFNGQKIDAKRVKLDGLIYYHPIADSLPERVAQIVDVTESKWNVRSLDLVDDRIEFVTVSGLKQSLPAVQVQRIDFSSGNTVWLDELRPVVQWQPYIESTLPHKRLARLFDPRFGGAFDGRALQLGGQAYDRGLAVWSRTELTYRLTEEYRQFHAVVGISDRYGDGGNVRLIISDDQRELFSQTITGADEPLTLDLDISGVRRLKILVDYGMERDMRDHLNLCDARLTK